MTYEQKAKELPMVGPWRKITDDGVNRILWAKLDGGEWVEIRRVKLRRVLH